MKRLASFLMIVVLMLTVTWSRATIPDTKENSKTEKLKEVSATMVKTDLNFSNQYEFLFVNQNYSDLDYVIRTESVEAILPTKSIRKFSKAIQSKNKTVNYRYARDGLSWRNQKS